MMMTRILASAVVILGAAFGALTAPAVAGGGPAGGTTQCIEGDAQGQWLLPMPGAPGKMSGVLKNQNGMPILGIKCVLMPPASVGGPAKMKGVLLGMSATGPQVVAKVEGAWHLTGPGAGTFIAKFTKQASPAGPVVEVGAIKGMFQTAATGASGFKAKFKLCH